MDASVPDSPRRWASGLGEAQAALAPQDAGQLLDQMLLGRSLRRVLDRERHDEGAVFARIFQGSTV
jgi:hypothetical protein